MYVKPMAERIKLPHFDGGHGQLTVIENMLTGGIKRVFFIRGAHGKKRGRHRHQHCSHLMVCLTGSCSVYVHSGQNEKVYRLHDPEEALLLYPTDWREMYDFSADCLLMCLSNTLYDPNDYIYEPYSLETPEQ